MVVRVDLSNPGFLAPYKLFGSRGALVNVRGNPAKKRNEQGDTAGIDVPYAPEAPFLVHHITRSYEDCKRKDVGINIDKIIGDIKCLRIFVVFFKRQWDEVFTRLATTRDQTDTNSDAKLMRRCTRA